MVGLGFVCKLTHVFKWPYVGSDEVERWPTDITKNSLRSEVIVEEEIRVCAPTIWS
jgi:hypothetical protein